MPLPPLPIPSRTRQTLSALHSVTLNPPSQPTLITHCTSSSFTFSSLTQLTIERCQDVEVVVENVRTTLEVVRCEKCKVKVRTGGGIVVDGCNGLDFEIGGARGGDGDGERAESDIPIPTIFTSTSTDVALTLHLPSSSQLDDASPSEHEGASQGQTNAQTIRYVIPSPSPNLNARVGFRHKTTWDSDTKTFRTVMCNLYGDEMTKSADGSGDTEGGERKDGNVGR
ncbi:hypothetical protein BC832DRAFT_171786 [Gaertneriomyces semiglobifer]|nr:hypothetical protein BC832DRAFT_171786 [Gaertneriomyces semiglobifer]